MKRSACLLFALAASTAGAQERTHVAVPQGDVTGLEMGIEGTLHVTPGGRLRWFVTVDEVVRGRELRPAAGTALSAMASFHRSQPVAQVVTDDGGRAAIVFDVPEDTKGSFSLVVEARSPKHVMRRFEATVTLDPRYRIELDVDRTVFEPGEPVYAWGRVIDVTHTRPAPDHVVHVESATVKGQPTSQAVDVTTDQAGVFHVTMHAPTEAGASWNVVASTKDATAASRTGLTTAVVAIPALIVQATPDQAVVAPGADVQVTVIVRTPNGRPVPHATLTGLSIPVSTRKLVVPPVLTDANGRARVPWHVTSTVPLADVSGAIAAIREGIGTGTGAVHVRVARGKTVMTWSVEGGAFVPGLPGQLHVRVHRPDGEPAAGVVLTLDGDHLTGKEVHTDAHGVARFELTLGPKTKPAPPECDGDTVAAATLHIDGDAEAVCLPVDPDATVRVRTQMLAQPGHALDVELLRTHDVAQAPVELALLVREPDGRWVPVAETVAASTSSHATLDVPAEARGLLWLRARPLVGPTRREVRGGSTMAWADAAAATLRMSAKPDGEVTLALDSGARSSTFAFALPVPAGESLLASLGHEPIEPGYLAAQTPQDEAVSSILRDGLLVPLAAPADPVLEGRLRDPRRSQERFVQGHLARVLHALEKHVADSLPDHLDNVATHGDGGWRWNREIMSLVAQELGLEALAGLDGEPLTIDALQALDPTIVFDNVARRITRERLMHLSIALEHFVRDKQLGYTWARRGDPSRWLTGLLDWSDPAGGAAITRNDLYDGWGHPFAIRAGQARFRFLMPIAGFELVSAGSDGKFATADDQVDPFARVLAAGTVFADAMGEDILLARLHQVELGRATLTALAGVFEAEQPETRAPADAVARSSWAAPPARLEPQALVPTLVGPEPAAGGFSQEALPVKLALSARPRRYLIVAGAYTAGGELAIASARQDGGLPFLYDAAFPTHLSPGETVHVPFELTYLGPAQELTVTGAATGSVRATMTGDAHFTAETGGARTFDVALTAGQEGTGALVIAVKGAGPTKLLELTWPVNVLGDATLRVQHTGRYVQGGPERIRLEIPGDAKPLGATLVVSAPGDLLRDPGFETLRGAAPAIVAWAHTLRGERSPDTLAAALATWSPDGQPLPGLQAACAVIAYGAVAEHGTTGDLGRALGWLRATATTHEWRERSAMLVALAAGATAATAMEDGDPVTALVRAIREESWEAIASERAHPPVMARLAAGLLLADRRDEIGRQLYDQARAALVAGDHGGRVLAEDAGAVDAWIGTIALALAARQLGDDALAAELARGLAPRLYLGMGEDPEAGFWLLAASVYGVFGASHPEDGSPRVTIDGTARAVTLDHGVATLAIGTRGADVSVTTSRGAPVIARLEARYLRKMIEVHDAPLTVRLDGELGHAGEVAALELTLESTAALEHPIVEIVLPGLAELSAAKRRSLVTAEIVAVDPPDFAGMVRIHFAPLAAHRTRRVPLPLRWLGAGDVRGLAITSYDADRPWLLTTLPSRKLTVLPPPKETW